MHVQVPFPDPRDTLDCNKMALWPDNHPYRNITYMAQLETAHRIFKNNDIICRKMMHAFRALGAGKLNEPGAEEEVGWIMACITVFAKEHRSGTGTCAAALCK